MSKTERSNYGAPRYYIATDAKTDAITVRDIREERNPIATRTVELASAIVNELNADDRAGSGRYPLADGFQPLTLEQYRIATMERNAARNIAADRKRTAARLSLITDRANRTATGAALLSAFGPEVLATLKRGR